jgi:hypothetical protein
MGANEKRIEDLLGRIDELIRILRFLADDLSEISKTLRESISPYVPAQREGTPEPLKPPISAQQTIIPEEPTAPQAISTGTLTVDSVQRLFPPDLAGLLYFEEAEEHILVKPRHYLGADNFRRVASIVRDQLGGEYISAGRDSHFRIPKS